MVGELAPIDSNPGATESRMRCVYVRFLGDDAQPTEIDAVERVGLGPRSSFDTRATQQARRGCGSGSSVDEVVQEWE